MRLRSKLSFAVHSYFQENGFNYVHTPIITGSDAEGAGEMFRVTTLDPKNPPLTEEGDVDWKQDFFGKATNLTVNSDLLNQAKSLKINLSATLEQALIVQVKNAQREQWLKENKDAIDELNKLSDENGLFSDSFRSF